MTELTWTIDPVKQASPQRPCKVWQDVHFHWKTHIQRSVGGNIPKRTLKLIRFRNYFCASITIKQKQKRNNNAGKVDEVVDDDEAKFEHKTSTNSDTCWKTVLKKHQLMRHPHYENDAQDWHTIIVINSFNKDYRPLELMTLRFYLQQPSPNWIRYELQDFSFETIDTDRIPISLSSLSSSNRGKCNQNIREQCAPGDNENDAQRISSTKSHYYSSSLDKLFSTKVAIDQQVSFLEDGKSEMSTPMTVLRPEYSPVVGVKLPREINTASSFTLQKKLPYNLRRQTQQKHLRNAALTPEKRAKGR